MERRSGALSAILFYNMPRLGDFAVLGVKDGAEEPDVAAAGLFDEHWQLPKDLNPGK